MNQPLLYQRGKLLRGQHLSGRIQSHYEGIGRDVSQYHLPLSILHSGGIAAFRWPNSRRGQVAEMLNSLPIFSQERNKITVLGLSDEKQKNFQSLISVLGASRQSRSKL